MNFANRLNSIKASPTMAVMQEAQRLKAQGVDVIDLGPGEPDFPTPEPIKKAAIQAIHDNFTKYTAGIGTIQLREAVANEFNETWGSSFTAANVAMTAGAKHAIHNLSMACFQSGQEVIIPAPYWVTFPEVIRITGADPVIVDTNEKDGFALRPLAVSDAITQRSAALILNTPNNPTGAVIPSDDVEEICSICQDKGVLCLSDETYERFVYGEAEHRSLAACVSPEDLNFAIFGSFSKTYAMTGWRVGYCISHPDRIKKIAEYQSHESGNPASISQKAALAALSIDDAYIVDMTSEYDRRRKFLMEGIKAIEGFRCQSPEGAFYAFPNVSQAMQATNCPDSVEFSKFLLEHAQVAVVPGSAFGVEGYIRLSYATSIENLEKALTRIAAAVSG
jgi:aspartate aminotransferase